MASEENLPEDGTTSPAASTNQVPQTVPLDASEVLKCPICLDTINDQGTVYWCGHVFCFSCILEWSCRRSVCPMCRGPLQRLYRKVGHSIYEVYHIVQSDSSASHARGGTSWPQSAERSHRHSSHRQHGSHSTRDYRADHSAAPERGQTRPLRRHHDGHRRVQHAQGYDPSSIRRRQSRAHDTACEEGRAPSPERAVPGSLGRSGRRQQGGWNSHREWQATRSRSQRRCRSLAGRRGQ